MKTIGTAFAGLALPLLLVSCSTLTLKEVQFGWPVESVLSVDEDGRIQERRYSLTADLSALAAAEFEDSTALRGKEIRLLRSEAGFYFITGKAFKHVYVFSSGDGELSLEGRIPVSEGGLSNPAMNQRPPYVELLDGPGFRKNLTSTSVAEEGGKE